ncbi:hypothetical protein PITC_010850 [Penicillium italicum]|uniref:Uncharacterized protein n=1 Tax=Penicillium italicum TaxID=40296 RepID=A0A0A2L565_PENIT|nr:hypothetical protein PITC_010850 [Penicillium italicum]
MPYPSKNQDLDIPMNTDESWDADDEDSGSERTLNAFDFAPLSVALGPKHETRRLFRFTVRREQEKSLVASGTDHEWTATFEKWRPQWKKVQAQVKTFGLTQFSSEIPPAPIDLALVQFFGSRVDKVVREFEIEQEGPNSASGGQDIWTLWRYIVETPADHIREFHVILRDTARLVGSQ